MRGAGRALAGAGQGSRGGARRGLRPRVRHTLPGHAGPRRPPPLTAAPPLRTLPLAPLCPQGAGRAGGADPQPGHARRPRGRLRLGAAPRQHPVRVRQEREWIGRLAVPLLPHALTVGLPEEGRGGPCGGQHFEQSAPFTHTTATATTLPRAGGVSGCHAAGAGRHAAHAGGGAPPGGRRCQRCQCCCLAKHPPVHRGGRG